MDGPFSFEKLTSCFRNDSGKHLVFKIEKIVGERLKSPQKQPFKLSLWRRQISLSFGISSTKLHSLNWQPTGAPISPHSHALNHPPWLLQCHPRDKS
jgi:hypothetical protein